MERREDGEGGRVGRTRIVRREIHCCLSYTKDGETDTETDDDEETRRGERVDEGHWERTRLVLSTCSAFRKSRDAALANSSDMNRTPGNCIFPFGETNIDSTSENQG